RNTDHKHEEVEHMAQDAEANAAKDKRLADLAQARTQADALVHSTRKSLEEYGDKLTDDDKQAIESAIKELEETLQDGDKDAIDAKVEQLTSAAQKLGEQMYEIGRASCRQRGTSQVRG